MLCSLDVPSSKLPTTAMVAPLVGYPPPQKLQKYDPNAYSPTSSPIISVYATERHDYISHAFSSPSLDGIHERSFSRGGSPPIKGEITTRKLHSLMSEKSQIIDRFVRNENYHYIIVLCSLLCWCRRSIIVVCNE